MPLTTAELKQLMADELYRSESPAFLATVKIPLATFKVRINSWWTLYEDKFATSARLGYLYVKRHALRYLREQVWTARTHRAFDRNQSDSDLAKAIDKMIVEVTIELNMEEGNQQGGRNGLYLIGGAALAQAAAEAAAATAEVAQLSPLSAASVVAAGNDPNAAAYRGSPIETTTLPTA